MFDFRIFEFSMHNSKFIRDRRLFVTKILQWTHLAHFFLFFILYNE